MPAARSVSDEPAVDTSWASHISTKSGRRKTATDETGAAVASSLMAAKHTVRTASIRASPARDADPAGPPWRHPMSEPGEAASLRALEEVAARAGAAGRLEPPGGEAVLRSVVQVAVTLFAAEAVSIALHDPATDRLVI